ncbi:Malonyl CoA-acyl carrier protein transacylase [bioreactor metagenome]|uniref:[acyl-carrier-protein] S-malonyltransferase n=1 Tax=bioreactor metagenome TaxID=1076179 RepID=A0A644ZID4_9ZZZZ|nr:ACP S-malonyltransferase [Candidatus Metalachnospira sp.]
MGSIAFVFSGQGAQYSGMGKDLYDNVPVAAEIFKRLDGIRPGTSIQCFEGSKEELSQTENTQPCMFALELAAAAALEAAGIKCSMTAGFSLGEISALTYSKAISLDDGFRLVCLRGKFMQDASEGVDGGMAAVIKLEASTVEELCSRYEHVYPVNYNCPGQISVSGLKSELADFSIDVKNAGGRAVPIRVNGVFHSPFMEDAAKKLGEALEGFEISTPKITLYSDYTADIYDNDYKTLLSKQICSPVRWQSIIENMIEKGIDTFIEIGPGKTLCGLISKINSEVRTFNVEDSESLNKTVREVL